MTPYAETYIGDWKVQYRCYDFKPDGWFQGQPIKYAVHATAEAPRPSSYPSNWTPTAMMRYPQNGFATVFDNDREGFDTAIAELTARIKMFEKR